MKGRFGSNGFALMLVLWTLIVLSTVAMMFAAWVGTEIRAGQDPWNTLQAERLAKSGHELATYLDTRSLGTTGEDFAGLPVQAVIAGMTYRATFEFGSVDLVLEGDNRNIDPTSAGEAFTENFFTVWTGDAQKGREIASSIADWMDSDDDSRFYGAESFAYSGEEYRPRNGGLGMADLVLVKGLQPKDFLPSVRESNESPDVRNPLSSFIAMVPGRAAVNLNYAPRIVLEAIPG